MNRQASWRAIIPDVPPSANQFLRTHWGRRAKLKEKFQRLLYKAFFGSGVTKAEGKRKVTLILHTKRQRDYANNFLAADKCILDSLVNLGYLKDDSPKWLELSLSSQVGTPQTIIEISEVENA